ncbi:MAG: hypothetical protein AAGF19_09705 [Pseudomonadota bacterium]
MEHARLPIIRTILAGYGFVFQRFFVLIAQTLPILLVLALLSCLDYRFDLPDPWFALAVPFYRLFDHPLGQVLINFLEIVFMVRLASVLIRLGLGEKGERFGASIKTRDVDFSLIGALFALGLLHFVFVMSGLSIVGLLLFLIALGIQFLSGFSPVALTDAIYSSGLFSPEQSRWVHIFSAAILLGLFGFLAAFVRFTARLSLTLPATLVAGQIEMGRPWALAQYSAFQLFFAQVFGVLITFLVVAIPVLGLDFIIADVIGGLTSEQLFEILRQRSLLLRPEHAAVLFAYFLLDALFLMIMLAQWAGMVGFAYHFLDRAERKRDRANQKTGIQKVIEERRARAEQNAEGGAGAG